MQRTPAISASTRAWWCPKKHTLGRVRATTVGESGGLTHVPCLATIAALLHELHPGGRVVQQEDVDAVARAESLDLVPRVVALLVTLEVADLPLVVAWAVTPAKAADPHTLLAEVDRLPVRQVGQAGQDLLALALGEPSEVFVVANDEHRWAWCGATFGEPRGEVTGPVVLARRSIDPLGVRPDAEVAHVQYHLEAHTKRSLEGEDI